MKLKKLTSWLLTAVMILSLVPMSVFANTTEPCVVGCTTDECVDVCDTVNHIVGCEGEVHVLTCPNNTKPTKFSAFYANWDYKNETWSDQYEAAGDSAGVQTTYANNDSIRGFVFKLNPEDTSLIDSDNIEADISNMNSSEEVKNITCEETNGVFCLDVGYDADAGDYLVEFTYDNTTESTIDDITFKVELTVRTYKVYHTTSASLPDNSTEWTLAEKNSDGEVLISMPYGENNTAPTPVYFKVEYNNTIIPFGDYSVVEENAKKVKSSFESYGSCTYEFVNNNKYAKVDAGQDNGHSEFKIKVEAQEYWNDVWDQTYSSNVNGAFNVYGYSKPSDATSEYATAEVVPATVTSGDVFVTNVSSDFILDKEGFKVVDEKLLFDTSKGAGSYDITVGTKTYVVAVFPEVTTNTTNITYDMGFTKVGTDVYTKDILTEQAVNMCGPDATGYFVANYRTVMNESTNQWVNMVVVDELRTGIDFGMANGNVTTALLFKMENGQIVNMEEPVLSMVNNPYGKTSYLINQAAVNYGTTEAPINAYSYSITTPYKSEPIKTTTTVRGSVAIYENNEVLKSVGIVRWTDAENSRFDNQRKYGITSNPENLDRNDEGFDLLATVDGTKDTAFTYYFVKGTGTPVVYDYVLYDEIDISSIQISSSDPDTVKLKEYVTEVVNGKNIIGFTMEFDNYSKFNTEAVEVSFKLKNDPNTVYTKLGEATCREIEKVHEETVVSGDATSLLRTYKTMKAGTLNIPAGTYVFDNGFEHYRNDIDLVGQGEVIFKTKNVTKPVLALKADFTKLSGIIVDGTVNNTVKQAVGIDAQENNGVYSAVNLSNSITVQNCSVGVKTSNPTSVNTIGVKFINNKVGLIINNAGKSHKTDVHSCEFIDNDVAILYKDGTATVNIKNNNFVDNEYEIESHLSASSLKSASITQNFFGETKDGAVEMKKAPNITKTATTYVDGITEVDNAGTAEIYYAPFYTTEERNVMSASLEGAENTAVTSSTTTAYKLPVTLEYSDVTTFDSNVFKEINKATGDITAAVPVTEIVENVPTVTTEWNFDKETLLASDKLPATMDLKVTDKLSTEAQAIVDGAVEDQTAIVQAVNFKHKGELPGEATVKIIKTAETTAENLKLYYVDEESKEVVELAICDVTEVTENGITYFVVTVKHCSEYIIATGNIVIENKADSEEDESSSSSSSKKDKETATATPAPTTAPVVAKPTAPTANDFISAQEVEAKLDASTAEEVIFDVTDKEIVSAKAFEALAQAEGKSLVFETDDFRWTFAASDITDASAIEGTTFKPAIKLESPNAEAIKALVGDAAEGLTNIYFEHHGKLPGKAKVEIFVGADQAGLTKYVYHYIPAQNGFEYIETITLTEKGWAAFEIYGCSDYILSDVMLDESLVIEAEAETPTQPEEPVVDTPTEEPAQQDGGMGVLPIILIAVVVLAVVIVLIKKRKTE